MQDPIKFFIYLFGILFPIGLGSLTYFVWSNVSTPTLSSLIQVKTNNGKSDFLYNFKNFKWQIEKKTYCVGICDSSTNGGGWGSSWGGGFGGK